MKILENLNIYRTYCGRANLSKQLLLPMNPDIHIQLTECCSPNSQPCDYAVYIVPITDFDLF